MLVVVMHSTRYASERLVKETPFFNTGGAGVDIFFVISGFVMIISSQSLLTRSDGWKQFGLRRIVRIVPLYWSLLTLKLVTLLLVPSVLRVTHIAPWAIIGSYLFVPSFNHDGDIAPILFVGWTLNFEMFFYLLLAIALKFRLDPFKFVGGVFAAL
jgi:exopolysaccharide production protein ExoZ